MLPWGVDVQGSGGVLLRGLPSGVLIVCLQRGLFYWGLICWVQVGL